MLERMSPLCGDHLAQKSVSNYMPERVEEMVPFHFEWFNPCYESHFGKENSVAVFLVLLNEKLLIAKL